MPDPDLTGDIAEARDILEPYVTHLKGLLHLWNMFENARMISAEFHVKFDDLTDALKLACSKGLVVSYTQPWSGNRNPNLNSLVASTRPVTYTFLNTIESTDLHEALYEARNKLIAHLDDGFEGVGVETRGGLYVNSPGSGRTKQDGTIDDAYVPFRVVVASKRGVWFLDNKDRILDVLTHIQNAQEAAAVEFRSVARDFRDECLEHAHVLTQLTDLFTVETMSHQAGNIHVPDTGVPTAPGTIPDPTTAKIEMLDLVSYVTHYETTPLPNTGSEVLGKGYRIKIGDFDVGENLKVNVSFPIYPHPKVKPTP